MEAKLRQNEAQKALTKSMFFWFGFGMALETLGCGGAATGLRRGHFLQRLPQGGPRARGVIKQKQAKRDGLEDLTRLGPLARRIIHVSTSLMMWSSLRTD